MQLNKIADLIGWRAFSLAVLAGVLLALGQAPFNFPWFVFVAIPVLFLLGSKRTARGGFWVGWFAGLGYFALALHWIVEPFLVDLARTGWMAPFALVLLAGGLALFWAVPFAVLGVFRGRALALAAVWTFSEFARSTILTGFPWALLAYGWVETPIIQATAFVGSHGLTLLILLTAMLPVVSGKRGCVAVVAVVLVSWVGFGTRVQDVPYTDTTVRLIQPNAPQHLKWHPDHIRIFWERQLASTAAPGNVDLIVWPESAVPYLMGTRPDLNKLITDAAGSNKVVLGASRREEDTWFNSAVVLGKDGAVEALYDKHHLVPFGEFLPFPSLFDRFGLQSLAQNAGRFSWGPGPQQFTVDDAYRKGPPQRHLFPKRLRS